MKPEIEQANRALFAGDRSRVLRELGHAHSSAQEVWLTAAAVEDLEERHHLLRQVARMDQALYAAKARAILAREREFEAEMNQIPAWQAWFIRNRSALVTTIIVVAGICGILLLFLIVQG